MQLVTGKKKPLVKRFAHAFRQDVGAWVLMLPSLILFIFFVWQPLVNGLILSLFETKGFDPVRFIGLQNFIDVVQESSFRGRGDKHVQVHALGRSSWASRCRSSPPCAQRGQALQGVFPLHGLLSLHRSGRCRGHPVVADLPPDLRACSTRSCPSLASTPSLLQNQNLVIPCIVIMMTWKGFGSTAILYLASLQGVNQELYEAAMIDGAGVFRKFWNITLPSISGMFSLMLVMQIIGVFQVMYEPLTMTDGGPNNASISLMLTSYFYGFRFYQAGRAAAVGSITFLFLIGLTILYFYLQKKNDNG